MIQLGEKQKSMTKRSSPSLFGYPLSVSGCRLRMNSRFAPMTLLNSHWQAPLFNLFFIVRIAKTIKQDQIDYVIEPKPLCCFRTEIPIQRYFQRVLVGKIVIAKR
jgi:hypothetical protein